MRTASTPFIRGGGDGHGIGMSQSGADGCALHGKRHRSISTPTRARIVTAELVGT